MRPSDVAKRVAALDTRFDKLPALLPEERHELLIRIRTVAAGGDWSSVTARDLRRSAELLFAGDARLAQMPGFLKGYLAAIAVNTSILPRLVSVYCMHFDLKDTAICEIGAFLVSNLARLPPVWAERHQSTGLFDPDQAPSRIANNLSDVAAPAMALRELARFIRPSFGCDSMDGDEAIGLA